MNSSTSVSLASNAARLLEKYPDKVPIVLERSAQSNVPELPNRKFLVPRELSVSQFLYTIRKRIQLDSSQAIYLFFGNTLPSSSETMGEVFERHRHPTDHVLYGTYSGECTFG